MAAERVGRTVARAAACSGMTGLRCSWRQVDQLVGCVAADTAGREQPEAAAMKGRVALDTVAELVGSALLDCMHHSHNLAHRVTSPG